MEFLLLSQYPWISRRHVVNVQQVFITLTYESLVLILGVIYLPHNTALSVLEVHTTALEQLISSINPSSFLSLTFTNIIHILIIIVVSLLDFIFSNSSKVTVNGAYHLVSPGSYHPPLSIDFPISIQNVNTFTSTLNLVTIWLCLNF